VRKNCLIALSEKGFIQDVFLLFRRFCTIRAKNTPKKQTNVPEKAAIANILLCEYGKNKNAEYKSTAVKR